jgi:hypothetical protein
MKKKTVLVSGGVILGIAGAFYAGAANADSNPFQSLVMDSAHIVANHGTDQANNLTTNASADVKNQMQDQLGQKVTDEENKVDSALQDYYKQKINDVVNGQGSTVSTTLDNTATNAIVNGKKQIDAAFASLLGN